MIGLVHVFSLFIIYSSKNIERKSIVIQSFYGMLQILIFYTGYYLSYYKNNHTSNILTDTLYTVIGAGLLKYSVYDYVSRKRLHHLYHKTKLDPDARYYYLCQKPKNIDIQRNMVMVRPKRQNRILNFQHTYYNQISIVTGIILPTALSFAITKNIKSSALCSAIRVVMVWHAVSMKL